MTAKIEPLLALELLIRNSIRAWSELVVEWTKELFDQSVSILAVKVVLALIPAAVISDGWTSFKVEEK
jgi:hypothetical protein